MNNNHPEVFRFYNNVFTKSPNKKVINDLFYWGKEIPKEKYNILLDILKQLNDIKKSLDPLIKLGIVFDIWLTGGSVRDFLLNKETLIKDLDVMIQLNTYCDIELLHIDRFLKETNFKVDTPKLKKLSLRDSEKPFSLWTHTNKYYKSKKRRQKEDKTKEQVYFDIFTLALGQHFEIEEFYPPKEKTIENAESYLDLRLKSVIKIKKDSWKWPVDILMTDYDIDGFLQGFDVGICQASLEYVNKEDLLKQKDTIPKKPEDLLKLAQINYSFLEDIKNKELKLRVTNGMEVNQIINSLENHFPRLEEKYDWKIVINYMNIDFTENFNWDKEELENLLKKDKKGIISMVKNYFLSRKIKNNLDEKSISITPQKNEKKIKI